MQIRDVAAKLGISARSVRFYEQKGLIRPEKDAENGYRRFTEQDLWRLQTIVALREAGLGLGETAAALDRIEAGDGDELLGLLELQRSAMYARWLEWKQQIETTERLIGLLRDTGSLAASELTALAAGARRLREARSGWVDRWDFDGRAARHDAEVSAAAQPEAAGMADGGRTDGGTRLKAAGMADGGLADGEAPFQAARMAVAGQSDATARIRPHYEETLSRIAARIRPQPGEHGLDLGAGTGNLAGRLLGQGAQMAAMDQSREMLKRCRAKYPGIETRQGNFVSVPYPDARFDFVVSSFAFRHLDETQQALALSEQRRVLKPGGRLVIADLMNERGRQTAPGEPVSLAALRKRLAADGFAFDAERVGDGIWMIYAEPGPPGD
ncbi:MerR family transcriptional regulator [Cohnella nanjingensis]|uniref:Methyltransferase domain-containing protein n=1 Tax=Cohnella nanjingensis TaxID=1387779 RepID=A0A7X0RPF9_9BACL|nr:methyltransferase domain-containing protein [Cohnella nanjingensis]MBB6671249.1 methyltransferase domain-containing protein [Cohnella nanjingensis]